MKFEPQKVYPGIRRMKKIAPRDVTFLSVNLAVFFRQKNGGHGEIIFWLDDLNSNHENEE